MRMITNHEDYAGQAFQNLVFFSALIFSRRFVYPDLVLISILGYILLCILSFLILRFARSILHAPKPNQSLIAGMFSFRNIPYILFILCILGFLFYRDVFLCGLVFLYVVIGLSHDLFVKDMVIVDVLGTGIEFSLRASIGAAIIATRISPWLIICTFLLALMVSLGQRRNEILQSDMNGNYSRKVLTQYTPKLLDQMIAVVTSSTILAYSLYTISSHPLKAIHSPYLVYTIIFVLYGVMRFIYLVYTHTFKRNIEFVLITDKPLILNFIIWLCFLIGIIVLASKSQGIHATII